MANKNTVSNAQTSISELQTENKTLKDQLEYTQGALNTIQQNAKAFHDDLEVLINEKKASSSVEVTDPTTRDIVTKVAINATKKAKDNCVIAITPKEILATSNPNYIILSMSYNYTIQSGTQQLCQQLLQDNTRLEEGYPDTKRGSPGDMAVQKNADGTWQIATDFICEKITNDKSFGAIYYRWMSCHNLFAY